jgi:hypothetical protein
LSDTELPIDADYRNAAIDAEPVRRFNAGKDAPVGWGCTARTTAEKPNNAEFIRNDCFMLGFGFDRKGVLKNARGIQRLLCDARCVA